jgi:asparagine synthase (glutamine-hydrolysing)
MCGICGTVGRAAEHEIAAMTEALVHRGPDGAGIKLFGGDRPAAIGNRRLAILDPTAAGAQPMSLNDRWWITYNGEIYNFRELRRELELEGERFRSEGDTEVLLRLFALRGSAMLERLNGIFAFAIWDEQEKRMFVARDRLGIKPLYYTQQNGCIGFSSELKGLLPLIGQPELDPTALADFLTFLWVPDPKTAFREVFKIPPGHYAWISDGGIDIREYWDLTFAPEERPEHEWREEVAATVQAAVKRQMVSDVPLGSFLSGGVDSSAIVAAMKSTAAEVSTWTIGFLAEDLEHEIIPDDLRYAREVGNRFDTIYHERIVEADVLDLLPKAVWHLEEPVADPAAISTYLICREARQEMPVMLSGMGGDEVFAGYPRHLAFKIAALLGKLPEPIRSSLGRTARPFARPGNPGRLRGPRRNLWKFMRAAELPRLERYLSFSSYYTQDELGELLLPDRVPAGYDPLAKHREYLQRANGAVDDLSRLLYLDFKTFLPCLNLTYTDKMGMAASVEVRVPLLDDELVALSARIPSRLKLNGWRRKYIFKRSQERALPREIVWRRKAGFGAPVRSWLVGDLAPLVDDLLSPATIERRGFVDPDVVAGMRAANETGAADNSLRLYALITLELWCRTFLDRSWKFEPTRQTRIASAPAD